ncbi:putative nuclease HARBI1 [Anabrus simplex]|uniref:putative nuclease HARBI1 n=1 Tax=Anabrus simplex TaxID=316456 RepID=UPI0035A2708C
MMVLEMIGDAIKHKTDWNKALSPETILLLALRLYASGSMLITVGDFCGVSKSTACRAVQVVSHHIALLRDRFIKFPATQEERIKLREQFYKIARFPRVVGALDCTHVRIVSPGGENAEIFRNRKGFFSMNVQTLCDPDLKITDIVARWPGSTHDSTIFNNSVIRARFESGVIDDGSVIIGDSGYPNRPYLITPLAAPDSPEEQLFNESQIRTRNCVERSYGVWKRRFPILSTGIRLHHNKVQSIVVATAVLHNICCLNNDMNLPVLEPHIENAVHVVNNVPNARETQNFNNSVRNAIIYDHFKNLRQIQG